MKKEVLLKQLPAPVSGMQFFLWLLLTLLACTEVKAQNLIAVGTATSTSSSSGLSSSTTTGTRNERHACIYSATELTAAGLTANSALIGIAWEKTGVGSYTATDLTIRIWLKHSAANTFAASPVFATETSPATLVYESTTGTIPAVAGWLPFNLNTAFIWNGIDAIQVTTELVRPASWTATGFLWRTIGSLSNAAANASSVATTPPATLTRTLTRPQVRLEVATAGNDAAITGMVAPVSGIPGSQNIDVVLRNTGSATLTSAAISWTVDASTPVVYNWSGSLAPGATATVTLVSQSFALGAHTITATITGANGGADADAANNSFSRTIETCFPLAGNYTINNLAPASATNFTSFNQFSARLSSCGVGGNVTAAVTAGSGPYDEQVVFSNIPGSGATAVVMLEGNGSTITASTTSENRYVIRLLNMQYMTINNLKIDADTSSFAFMGIHLMGSGQNITISNCETDMKRKTSTLYGAYVASGTGASILDEGVFHNLNFVNDKATGGGYGVSVVGSGSEAATGIVVSNGDFYDFNSTGVFLRETAGASVHDNFFDRVSGLGGNPYAIQLSQSGNINGSVFNNYIRMSQTNGGLRGIYLFAGTGHKVYNNVFTDIHSESGDVAGIILRTAATSPQVYNNTIAINHTVSHTGELYGIRMETANTGALLRNNVISIGQLTTGFKAGIMLPSASGAGTTINSNNNLLWVPGGQIAGYTNITTPSPLAASLANWQALGQDAAATGLDPQLYSAALPIPTNAAVANLGLPYGGLVNDIQGNARNATTPDLGAYEYNLPLPVTLSRFYGERKSGVNKLYWRTLAEKNNKGFWIEQSDNGITFAPLGYASSLAPDGNSGQPLDYGFDDPVQRSHTSFYRLKQTDADGRSVYSAIVSIQGEAHGGWEVSLYPNPVSDKINISVASPQAFVADIRIYDLQGKQVLQETRTVPKEKSLLTISPSLLRPGIYWLHIKGLPEPVIRKFIKE